MKTLETKIFIAGILLSALITELIIFGGIGLGAVITMLGYLGIVIYFGYKLKKKHNLLAKGLLVAIVLNTLCFGLFSDALLRVFNIIFLWLLIGMHALVFFEDDHKEYFSTRWCQYLLIKWFTLPFERIEQPYKYVKEQLGEGSKEKLVVVGKIVLGICLALPILFIAFLLLISSDAAFAGMAEVMFDKLEFVNLQSIIARLIVWVCIFFVVFSYLYTIIMGGEQEITGPINSEVSTQRKGLDFIVVATIISLLGFLYLIYLLAQFTYFISAFQGILPEGFSSAEYARRGFFEAVPIIGLNLIIILILNLGVIIKEASKKQKFIKVMTYFFIGFSAFIATSALAKMFMYISRFGLTQKRIYVAWFLILTLICLVLILLKLIVTKTKLMRNLFIVFTIMYLGLNYANVDYIVANQNMKLYANQVIDDLDTCYELNNTTVLCIEKLVQENPNLKGTQTIEDLIEVFKEYEYQEETWEDWTLADYLADEAMKRLLD